MRTAAAIGSFTVKIAVAAALCLLTVEIVTAAAALAPKLFAALRLLGLRRSADRRTLRSGGKHLDLLGQREDVDLLEVLLAERKAQGRGFRERKVSVGYLFGIGIFCLTAELPTEQDRPQNHFLIFQRFFAFIRKNNFLKLAFIAKLRE